MTIFMVALTIIATPIMGQTYTKNAHVEETITRSNDDGSKRMHYVKTGTTNGVFLSSFVANGIFFTSHQISGYKINDFTIFNDTVYFCGEDNNGMGIYGWTSTINDQNFNWTFHVYKIYDNASTFTTDIRRIKVFRSGQDLNVLLIGMYKAGGSSQYGSVMHIKNNSTCTIAYLNSDFFDDVAILDNYVVTIERKGNGRAPYNDAHQMRVLNKNQFSLYDALFDYYHAIGQIQSLGRLWLQAANNNNRFFSVYRDNVGFYFNTFSVNGTGSLICNNYFSIATSSMPTIGDVAYNDYDKTLAILYNIDTVGTAAFFNCASFHSIYLSSANYPSIYILGTTDPQTKLFSVTKQPSSSDFVITGICHNKLVFWNTINCNPSRQLSLTSIDGSLDRYLWAPNRTTIDITHLTFMSPNSEYYIYEDCVPVTPWIENSGDEDGKED